MGPSPYQFRSLAVNRDEMRGRTKQFALRVIRLSGAIPRTREGNVLGHQILKSGTSVGANYREAQRASSKRHFVTILETALREADETDYWMELLVESEIIKPARLAPLAKECRELIAILSATVSTAKRRLAKSNSQPKTKSPIPNPKS
jgi:four helix bundle protein